MFRDWLGVFGMTYWSFGATLLPGARVEKIMSTYDLYWPFPRNLTSLNHNFVGIASDFSLSRSQPKSLHFKSPSYRCSSKCLEGTAIIIFENLFIRMFCINTITNGNSTNTFFVVLSSGSTCLPFFSFQPHFMFRSFWHYGWTTSSRCLTNIRRFVLLLCGGSLDTTRWK